MGVTGAFAERSIALQLQLGCIRLHCPPEFDFVAVACGVGAVGFNWLQVWGLGGFGEGGVATGIGLMRANSGPSCASSWRRCVLGSLRGLSWKESCPSCCETTVSGLGCRCRGCLV